MSTELFCIRNDGVEGGGGGGCGAATVSRVGSLAAGVRGSSDGRSLKPVPLTKPWFEITVPPATFEFTTTSNVMVARASASIEPGVPFGGLISRPLTSRDTAATSATAAPFSVVLPATYVVLTGTASRNVTF